MALKETNTALFTMPQGVGNGNGRALPNGNEERPQATLWLNVGLNIPVQQEDGTMVDTFISLPVGIPLDTTEPMVMRGSNRDWLNIVQVKNALLEFAQKTAAACEPGTGIIAENLQVQFFRKGNAAKASDPAENPLMVDMGKLLNLA